MTLGLRMIENSKFNCTKKDLKCTKWKLMETVFSELCQTNYTAIKKSTSSSGNKQHIISIQTKINTQTSLLMKASNNTAKECLQTEHGVVHMN